MVDPSNLASAFSGVAEDLAQKVKESEGMLAKLNAELDKARALEHTESDPAKHISVTVNGLGELQSVYISPRAIQALDHTALGSLIGETLTAARTNSVQLLQEAISRATGTEIIEPGEVKAPTDPSAEISAQLRKLLS